MRFILVALKKTGQDACSVLLQKFLATSILGVVVPAGHTEENRKLKIFNFLQYTLVANKLLPLMFLVCFLTACKEPIIHNLTESEANTVLSGLVKINVTAQKAKQADGNWSIAVGKSDVIPAIRYLKESRLLRGSRPSPEKESSLVASREDQRFHFERSLSREIEYTLTSIDGVLDARVHLNMPARDPLFGQKVDDSDSGSASILLVTDKSFELKKEELAALVAGASGIGSEFISVLVSVEPFTSNLKLAPQLPQSPMLAVVKGWKVQLVMTLFILGAFGLWVASRYHQKNQAKISKLKHQINCQEA